LFFTKQANIRKTSFSRGDWPNVILHGEKELGKDGNNVKVLNDLAFAYYMQQDFDRSLKLCENIYRINPKPDLKTQAKEIGPRYMRHHEILAEMYFSQGRDEEALAICKRLKVLAGIFSKKHLIAAQVYVRRGDLRAAANEYAEMAENCPDHLTEAGGGLKDLTKLDPLEDLPYQNLYTLYVEHNRLDNVISQLESLCSAVHVDMDSLYTLVYMYYFDGAYEKEIKLLHEKAVAYPDNSHLHFFLAKAYQAGREFEKAKQHLERAIVMAPQYADRYASLRNELASNVDRSRQALEAAIHQDIRERRPYKAIEGYDQLLSMDPEHQPYWIGLAQAIDLAIEQEVTGGDLEKAFEHLDQLELVAENYPAVVKIYANRSKQLTPRRIAYYEDLVRQGGHPVGELNQMHLTLGRLYTQAKDTGRAIQHWNTVIKAGGEGRAEAIFQLASHLLHSGKTDVAEPYVQQFGSVSCDSQAAKDWMYELALLSEKAGLRNQARNLYGKLLIADKKFRDVAQRLAALNQKGYSEEIPEGVMVLDICESSRMMDLYGDEATNSMKNMLEKLMFPIFQTHGAKFHKSTGDGFLVTFPRVDQAVESSIAILREVGSYNSSGEGVAVHLRFAVHFGAIRVRPDGDRHGTNVNIPFRVEGLKAENLIEVEGGMRPDELPMRDRILITEAAQQRLLKDNTFRSRYVGMFELRNITGAHKIYQVLMPETE